MDSFISLEDVSYTYPEGARDAPPALWDISIEIAEGEYVALVGKNGSGKSTLARHFNALLRPDHGTVRVAGYDSRKTEHHPNIRRAVGMVFQHPEDQMVATVVEHDVAFGPENLGLPREEIRKRVRETLETVGLWAQRKRPPHMLSAGQLQRLALAGVLAMRPRCIVFDEATAMLDPVGRRTVRTLMRQLHDEGLTVITITHLMEEAADAERIIVLNEGQVALDGPPEEVLSDGERLRTLGLALPPAAAVAEALRADLLELPPSLINVPALVRALDALSTRIDIDCPDRLESQEPEETPDLIEVADLAHVYMQETPFAQPAIRNVDLSVQQGKVHALMGATGSGKSTLLQHLNGLYRPQKGSVVVDGYDLTDPDVNLKDVRRHVGLVFQRPEAQIFEQYVGDEIAYGPRLAGLEGEALRERVRWAMGLVGLGFEDFKDRFTFALSGGEQRKVALASTLALRPRVLLLDEPTAGLDPASRQELIEHLRQFRETGMTMVLSSHQMEDIVALAEYATVMAAPTNGDETGAGTTVAHGSVAEVFNRGDQLRDWGLEQPMVSEIAEQLRDRGWKLPLGIITPDALVNYLRRCL